MKRHFLLLVIAPFMACAQDNPAVPKIVKTSPVFWEKNVSSRTATVAIRFDRPMRPGFSSLLGPSSILPNSGLSTEISADQKTLTLETNLEPGQVYVFALNERGTPGVGFQTPRGVALPPHFLVFQTSGAVDPENAPPRLVRSVPAVGSIDSAPGAGIALVFDLPMNKDKHGLRLFENGHPVDLAGVAFRYLEDRLTFVLDYPLKPNGEYELQLNDERNIGFASMNRIPLWPTKFRFSTGGEKP